MEILAISRIRWRIDNCEQMEVSGNGDQPVNALKEDDGDDNVDQVSLASPSREATNSVALQEHLGPTFNGFALQLCGFLANVMKINIQDIPAVLKVC